VIVFNQQSLFAGSPQEGTFIIPGMMKVPTPTLADAKRSSIRITIAGVGNSWTLMIFYALGNAGQGSLRYMEIKRAIGTISQRSLTGALRNLERDGYVARKVYPTSPPKVEYRLTRFGHSLLKAMNHLVHWADEHLDEAVAARKRYDESEL
jgi:DNA-binding HxlR family transcriptional regulator